jgi:hypothetical protein
MDTSRDLYPVSVLVAYVTGFLKKGHLMSESGLFPAGLRTAPLVRHPELLLR